MRSTIAPPDDPVVVDAHRRRPGWRRNAALAIVLALVGVATYAVWFLANYDPICHSSCTGASGASGPGMRDVGSFTSPEGDDFRDFRIAQQPGRAFTVSFPLEMTGPIGVTVERVGQPVDPHAPLHVRSVAIAPERGDPFRARRPFHPFALHRDEIFDVFVVFEMRGCMNPAAGGPLLTTMPLTYRVFGVRRHTEIALPETIEVLGNRASCGG